MAASNMPCRGPRSELGQSQHGVAKSRALVHADFVFPRFIYETFAGHTTSKRRHGDSDGIEFTSENTSRCKEWI